MGSNMKNIRFMASIVASSLVVSGLALADVDKKTERLWKAKCASCHGQEGKGDTEKGQQMKVDDMSTAAVQAKSDDDLKKAILNGVHTEKAGVKQDMPGFKDELTPDQVTAVTAYIRTFKK
jgi:mono/diheme cytochrome c family protein